MKTLNTIQKVKQLFEKNFTTLNSKLIDLNEVTIKVKASFDDGESGFTDSELILNCFDNTSDEEALDTMLEAIEEEWVEVEFKKVGNDYIITAGNAEGVYVLMFQLMIIK